LHPRPAKVEESMPKPNLLVDLGSILKAEWRRLSSREHLDGAVPDLYLARGQVIVHRSVGPMADRAGHAQDVLAPNIDRTIDHTLDDPRMISKVDEGKVLAVLPAPADPSTHRDRLIDVFEAERPTQGIS